MVDTAIAIQRIAQDAVRIQFVPTGKQGTAVFMISLAREPHAPEYEADREKVLLKAKAVAQHFIECADREINAKSPKRDGGLR